ncbi:MAG: NUDIX domain-containing protein [Puniceicoccaceae bacterium]
MDDWIEVEALRYCPSCGFEGIFKFQSNGLRCRACSFEFFVNVASAVAVLVLDGGGRGLFTVRQKDPRAGYYDLPGGFVDPGESLEEAARREVLEEVGIELEALAYVGSFPNRYQYGGLVYATADAFFISTVSVAEGHRADLEEIADLRWVNPREVDLDSVAFSSVRAFLEGLRIAQAGKGGVDPGTGCGI